jgi:hypothetical protein
MAVIERKQIEPEDLTSTIRAVDESTEIWVGEGRDRIIIRGTGRRSCGACSFCCTAAGINELKKPPHVRCTHLARPGACGIYPDRPKACQEFACGWLIGNFDERFRPDKIGAYCAFFATIEHGFYAVVQVDTRLVNKKRLRQLIRRLGYLPEIRIIYDDKYGVILHHGAPAQRFRMMPRAAGEYENAHYLLEDAAP